MRITERPLASTDALGMTAQEFLSGILRGILPRPDTLRVEQSTAGDVTVLTIHLPQKDRRFVIGKGAKNIAAIRDLLRAYAGRHNHQVVVKLHDEEFTSDEERQEHAYNIRGT